MASISPLVADVAPLVFDARGATMGIDAPNVVRLYQRTGSGAACAV